MDIIMKNLLRKEITLSMHPTAPMFLALSAMLLIPSYPYLIIFFYTCLALFFMCVTGRENGDVTYTLTLPVQKKDIVKARFAFAVLLELLQIILAVPIMLLRQGLNIQANDAGMDANTALSGFAFALLGLFNYAFFTGYYRNIEKIGRPFIVSCGVIFVYIGLVETCTHTVPFFKNCLDTPDPLFMPQKLLILAAGVVVFAVLTALAFSKSKKSFEKLDL